MKRLNKKGILPLVLTGVIFLFSIRNIMSLSQIRVLNDEFGYWGIAAYFSGRDWSEIMSTVPFYSCGYSLLLVPLFLLKASPFIMYKLAILLNAVLLSLSFLIAIACGKKLFKRVSSEIIVISCFVLTMYTNNIVQSQIAWSETLLYFLFWLLTFLMLKFLESDKIKYLIFFAIILGYTYMVHQRSIGIVFASSIFFVILCFLKKIKIKKILIFLLLVLGIFLVQSLVKDDLYTYLWDLENMLSGNDYPERINKLSSIFSIAGIKVLIKSTAGKIFYLLVSTFFIAGWGGIRLFKESICFLDVKKREDSLIFLFIFLAILANIGVAIVGTYTPVFEERIDYTIYGRYMEATIGPLLLCGFIDIYQKSRKELLFLGQIMVLLLSGWIVNRVFSYSEPNFNAYVSVGVYRFFSGEWSQINLAYYIICSSLLISLITYILFSIEKKKQIFYLLGITLILGMWIKNGNLVINDVIIPGQEKIYAYTTPIYELVRKEERDIYYIQCDKSNHEKEECVDYNSNQMKYLQYTLGEYSIKKIEYNQIHKLNNKPKYFIVLNDSEIYPDMLDKFSEILQTDVFAVFEE